VTSGTPEGPNQGKKKQQKKGKDTTRDRVPRKGGVDGLEKVNIVTEGGGGGENPVSAQRSPIQSILAKQKRGGEATGEKFQIRLEGESQA